MKWPPRPGFLVPRTEHVVIVGTPPPSDRHLARSKRRIRFEPVSWEPSSATTLVAAFRSALDRGGAQLATFKIQHLDKTGQWFLSRNRFEEYDFVGCLITSAGLAEALPEVAVEVRRPDPGFDAASPLSLDGSLAEALMWGGAYSEFSGTAAEAKGLGAAFSRDLIGDRFEDFRIDQTGAAWSAWFADVAWDRTWIITDRRNLRMTVLCLTDTD